MHPQKEALVRLLADNDEPTVRLVKARLAANGSSIIPDLYDLSLCDNPIAALHARDVLHELMQKDACRRFESLCTNFSNDSDLENACWLLSSALIAGLDVAPYRQRLASWGNELKRRLRHKDNEVERIQVACDFFAYELQLSGNLNDYYFSGNSLLPTVIDSRQGIPISLVLIYIFTGHYADFPIEGVNLPGHFLARHGNTIFDPFHHGRILTHKNCEEILRRQNKELHAWHLLSATPRQMLTRLLANLLYSYHRSKQHSLYAQVKNWSHLLCSPQ